MQRYTPKTIESKWQKFWEDKKLFAAHDKFSRPKYYCLIEFPYPSGEGLHVGHPRSYTALDVLARQRRMQEYNVLYPIGFDAFGLPSENYAVKTGVHPAETTKKNIATFTKQLKALGFSFDWDRAVTTTDPEYYKWTQWIFIKLWEKGLAYKDSMPINWCPSCKIGLANEEVVNGHCERCGYSVEKREKEQWLLRITNYADRLIEDLETVDYPQQVKAQQINWIGRSEGAIIKFQIEPPHRPLLNKGRSQGGVIEVFTTRPDTVFGATFMVLSPEHEIISNLSAKGGSQISNFKEVEKYIERAKKKSDLERTDIHRKKTGIELKGVTAINPLTNKKIPVWVADYVLAHYGTGAIMAVPAHDQRDWEFAKQFGLPIAPVVSGGDVTKEAFTDNVQGRLVNSGQFNGLTPEQAIPRIIAWLEDHQLGAVAVNYKLRDWVFSRQRYWGEPIPMIFCENCKQTGAAPDGWLPVAEKELPLELPVVKKYEPSDSGDSPLALLSDWVTVDCPRCGSKARRETDTMPNWAGSNWYFLRYADPKNAKRLADEKKLAYWIPVDWYNGGMEHTTLHLLYSRFIYKFLWDISAIPRECGPEPYRKRTSHGLILGENSEKMSKSRGNVVNPDDIIQAHGADTLRVYEMFMGPFSQAIPWSTNGVVGVRRFLERVWNIFAGDQVKLVPQADSALVTLTHQTIKKVTDDIKSQDYNTAVSALMILANAILAQKALDEFVGETFLKLLSPFAPHLAEELWEIGGGTPSIMQQPWPTYEAQKLKSQEVELVIQINGRVRDRIVVEATITEQRAESLAQSSYKVTRHLAGKTIKNVIFVPARLINFVVE